MVKKLACAAAVALMFVSTAQAADYSIRNLSSYGKDIDWRYVNNAGDVAGFKDTTVYVRGTTNTTFATDNGWTEYVAPTALANDGTVYTKTAYFGGGGTVHSVAANGTVTQLPLLPQTGPYPGRGSDYVTAVNNHGVAVGSASNGEGYTVGHGEFFYADERAVVYRDGQVVDIGTLGGKQAVANSVNDQGTVVGWAQTASGSTSAFIYADGQMTALRENSKALKINDAGVVAGSTNDGKVFLYENGVSTELTIEGNQNTRFVDLNNAGLVLGLADGGVSGGYFLYHNGETTFLDDLLAQTEGSAGWRMGNAFDINDKGEILISVYKNDGQTYSEMQYWVLSAGVQPVPEPGTWAMMLAGFGAIGVVARRRKPRA